MKAGDAGEYLLRQRQGADNVIVQADRYLGIMVRRINVDHVAMMVDRA